MKRLLTPFIVAMLLAIAGAVRAADATVTLDVPGMFCVLCQMPVKKALQKVDGVSKAEVSHEKKEAVVTFDAAKTSVETLMKATKEAGYPSVVKGGTPK